MKRLIIIAAVLAVVAGCGKDQEKPATGGDNEPDPATFYFAAEEAATIAMRPEDGAPTVNLEYNKAARSGDKTYTYSGWQPFAVGSTVVSIDAGDRVYFRAGGRGNSRLWGTFVSTGCVAAGGNIMYLLDGTGKTQDLKPTNEYAFFGLFQDMTTLRSAGGLDLPASTLAKRCYLDMFAGCSSLTTAPKLPATTLAEYCYWEMFAECGSLSVAPELPATALAYGCYASMFEGCRSLTAAPKLPATILKEYCYDFMFKSCSSLATAPELPATTLAAWCYSSMFAGCVSLTAAPGLPAGILSDGCYSSMFAGCAFLATAPALPATYLADWCYSSMFNGCASLATAPELPATTLANYCYGEMFGGCTSLRAAPELPAPILTQRCYESMFLGCSRLQSVTMRAADVSAEACLVSWLRSAGTSVTNPTLYVLSSMVNDATIASNRGGFTVAAIPTW